MQETIQTIDEKLLVEEAKKDSLAFGKLYDLHYPAIYGFLLKRTGHSDVAKDLTSETFFQALKNIHKYEQRGRPFKSWLFSIAVAQIGTYYRSRRKLFKLTSEECPSVMADELYQPDVEYLSFEDSQNTVDQIKAMRRVFRRLNDTHQTILTLRYLTPHSVAEIAQILGMKEGTVKSHIHRALKKLQTLMRSEKEATYDTKQRTTTNRNTALASESY